MGAYLDLNELMSDLRKAHRRDGKELKEYNTKVTTTMSKKTKKIKHVKWLENDFTPLPSTVEKSFRYPSDYECIWGISPFAVVSEKANIDFKDLLKIHDKMIEDGFVLLQQEGFDKWITYKFVDYANKIFVSYEDRSVSVSFYPLLANQKRVEDVVEMFLKKAKVDKNNNFVMIAQGQEGLYNEDASYKAKALKGDRFDLYYGKDFPHDKFLTFMDEDTDNLLMLHGDPGTGKSNYIKHLITETEKTVIYIPPSMLGVISQPSFVSYMLSNKDSILLIEDAEEILSIDRNSATNNLLGLTDGFLKDSLNLKIIVTFNCDIGKIDPALLRKGRLFYEYKFGKLSTTESRDLAEHCGLKVTIDEPMTLAEIFNMDHETSQVDSFTPRFMGFGVN